MPRTIGVALTERAEAPVEHGADLLIRDALPSDNAAVVALTLAANQEHAAALPEGWWEPYSENIRQTLGAEEPGQIIVAELEGRLAGSVLLLPAEAYVSGYPEVRLLAVDPAARGRHIASALMAECFRRTRLSGAVTIGLHTMEVMTTARRMYERLGFVRAPEFDFYSVAELAVQGYRLDLDPDPDQSGRNTP
jgi:ribosomal protein S18 acetylase RimI-like enzyme